MEFLQQYLGTILLVVLVVLGALLLIYSFFTRKNVGEPTVASVDEEHFLEMDEAVRAAGFHVATGPSAAFFGRMSVVRRVGTDQHGLCLAPPPHLVDEETCKRFSTFAKELGKHPIEGVAPLIWWRADHDMFASIQGEFVRDDGHMRMNLREYRLDRALSLREKEGALLAIAHVLKKLADRGIYHGWLLPRSLYVVLDPQRVIRGIRIADAGLVHAFGPEKVFEQIQRVHARDIGMDAYRRHRLLNELHHLSPEQKQRERLGDVGPASDFYAFGSLATRLFDEVPLWGHADVDWGLVPERWRDFLQACLSDRVEDRPDSYESIPASFNG